MDVCIEGMSVAESVLGNGINLTPRPNTIFSVGLRTYVDRLKISVLVILLYFRAKAS